MKSYTAPTDAALHEIYSRTKTIANDLRRMKKEREELASTLFELDAAIKITEELDDQYDTLIFQQYGMHVSLTDLRQKLSTRFPGHDPNELLSDLGIVETPKS